MKIADAISRYQKFPSEYIYHYKLHERINNIEHIHVLGFSFSDIDIPYLEWIVRHTSRNCDWKVSWHSEEDKRRIYNFFREKPSLRPQMHLFQIKETDD